MEGGLREIGLDQRGVAQWQDWELDAVRLRVMIRRLRMVRIHHVKFGQILTCFILGLHPPSSGSSRRTGRRPERRGRGDSTNRRCFGNYARGELASVVGRSKNIGGLMADLARRS